MVARRGESRLVCAGLPGFEAVSALARATLRRAIAGVLGHWLAAQDDARSTRLISRASSVAVQADSRTPSREAHSRRASGPLPALAQADPKFHAG
jgi:hypothetical protein